MARKVEEITVEIGRALGEKLDDLVPKIRQVTNEFPGRSTKLKYPALSVFANDPDITPMQRYIHEQGVKNDTNPDDIYSINKYVTAKLDFTLQLDLWCRSKEERSMMVNLLQDAFEEEETTSGITLTLKNYHDIIARYDLVGIGYEDSEIASQRKEWRAKIDVIANCKKIVEKRQGIILVTELDLETPDFIPDP